MLHISLSMMGCKYYKFGAARIPTVYLPISLTDLDIVVFSSKYDIDVFWLSPFQKNDEISAAQANLAPSRLQT